VPFSSLVVADVSGEDPAVDADRFQGPNDQYPGGQAAPPASWETLPDVRLLSQEKLRRVAAAVEVLPPAQRAVIRLRDIEGWDSDEV
jgi:RNA polymerase sigma-70 factor (ECF subfamily)